MAEHLDSSDTMLGNEKAREQSSDIEAVGNKDDFDRTDSHLTGLSFWCTMFGLYLGAFLVTMEMTVVSTSLVAITDDLQDLQHASWVINAYLLTWTGFLILWAQFSHTFGRQRSLLISVALFVLFSGACAAAQTSIQLSILRAFQGLGGSGVFCLPIIIISEAVPPSAMPIYAGVQALVALVSFGVGPLIGGAIASNTTWRWVFIINVPLGVVVFLLDLIGLPSSFPDHNKPQNERRRFQLRSLKQLDLIGGTLFLVFSILLVTAFLEADDDYSWNSAAIICLLVFSAVAFSAFLGWEFFVTTKLPTVMPVLTWRFANRKTIAMFMASFLIGLPFITTLIQIPQSYQLLKNTSPLGSAIRLLPYILVLPVGSSLGSIYAIKVRSRPMAGQLAGAMLQLIAAICFAVLPLSGADGRYIPARQYGFQVLIGFGSGFTYTINFSHMPFAVGGRKELVAPGMGASTQFRYLGGTIGLGVVTAAFNTHVRNQLSAFLSPQGVGEILQTSGALYTLPTNQQYRVLQIFTDGFQLQWEIVCAFIGLQVVAIFLTW